MYDSLGLDLFSQLVDVPGLNIKRLDTKKLCELLLCGDPKPDLVANRIIIEATIYGIELSKRF